MLNALIGFSLQHRVAVLIGSALLLLGGILAYTQLPIDAVPDITNNQVQILTGAPALSALEIERYVTFPLELAVKQVPGLVELRSLSRPGLSVITVVFEENVDIYFGRQLLLESMRGIEETLPEGVETPALGPVTTGLGEIFRYVVRDTTGRLSPAELRTVQDWIVRRGLLGAEALAEVNSLGGDLKQYQILVNPESLAAYNLTLREVFHAAGDATGNAGGGYIEVGPEQLAVRSVGLATSLDDLRSAVIRSGGEGVPITLGDVAEVTTGPALRFGSASQDGKGEVVVGIVMQLKGANARTTVTGVKERIEKLRPSLPEGVVIEPFYDREALVDRTIETVVTNLVEGALLVIGVLLLLLVSLRAGLVLASVIPLAMAFAGIMMLLIGESGNLMSLGAIDFGLVVDGSLIIVENVLRLLDRFYKTNPSEPITADRMKRLVYDGAIEVRKAAQYGEIIIIVVYLPILTLAGVEGKLFRPMALTVGFALLGALILSITYVPALLSFALKGKTTFRHSPVIEWLRRLYRPLLDRALVHPRAVIIGALAIILLGAIGFTRLGGEFVPRLDEGDIAMHLIRLPSISLSESQRLTTATEKVLMEFPEVLTVVSHTGRAEVSTDPMGFELADVFIMLREEDEWGTGRTKEELIEEMGHEIKERVPGVGTQFTQPIEMRTNELIAGARNDVVVKIFGEDFGVSGEIAERIGAIMRETEGGSDVLAEQIDGLPQMVIRPDRMAIARYGMTVADLNQIIGTAVAGATAGEIFEGERRFDLIVRFDDATRRSPETIRSMLVTTPVGARVPLSELAAITIEDAPLQVSREQGERFTSVQANVRGRDIASYVEEVSERIDREIDLPEAYRIDFGGTFENLQEATLRLMIVIPLALLLVFALLYQTFRSLRSGVIIFLCIPMAVVGGIAALLIRGLPFSISAAVGFIALFGIAVLNGIVMLAAIRNHQKNGKSREDAVRLGADERLRPVITTAALAGFGFLPMMLSTSAGAEVQRPLATVVVGGLISATILTLIVLPVIYNRFGRYARGSAVVLLLILIGGGADLTAQTTVTKEEFLDRLVATAEVKAIVDGRLLATDAERRGSEIIDPIGLTFEAEEYPTGGLPGEPTLSIGVGGTIRYPGTFDARARARRAATAMVALEGGEERRDVLREGLALWYGLLRTELRSRLIDSGTAHAREILRIATRRRAAGDIDSLEVLRAQLPLAYALQDSIALTGERRMLLVAASTAIGLSPGVIMAPRFESSDPLSLDTAAFLAALFAADPALQLIQARRLLAEAEQEVSATERRPRLDLGLGLSSVEGSWGYLKGGVTIGLPIGRWGEDPATEAYRFAGEVIDLEMRRRERRLRAHLLLALEEIESAGRMLQQYDDAILPLLRESWRTAMILYREGATGYINVIEAHETLLEGELERLDLELKLRETYDQLIHLSTPLPPATEESR